MVNHPNRALKWSSDNELARRVCEELGFRFEAKFVEAAVSRAGPGYILVRGTAGHPEEFQALGRAVDERGWHYRHIDLRRPTEEEIFEAECRQRRDPQPLTAAEHAQISAEKERCARIDAELLALAV